MCGIIGVFGRKNSAKLVVNGLKKINYRGRDGFSVFDKDGFALGHCLHAIINKIKQPFVGKGIFLTNCEIYNWQELKRDFSLNSRNDAELFFDLLETKPMTIEAVLSLVNGDYAGAYLRDNKLYLFRDIFGVKPLWYSLDNGFGFASEKKALKEIGFSNIIELNPRQLLVYDIKKNKIKFIERKFFNLGKTELSYARIKTRIEGYLINAIAKRVPDVKFGLLFSGGLDSSIISLILKKLGVEFTCYFSYVKGLGDAKDLEYAKDAAKTLDLDLKIVDVDISDVEKELPLICKLVESNNVTKISVALPFYFALKKAKEDKIKVILSGQGSEEVFGGYERHVKSLDVNKECLNGLMNIYERDLYRDDVISMFNNIELRVPFLDIELVSFSLNVDSKYKVKEDLGKIVLRDVSLNFGLDKKFAYRKRKAAQYGSNFLKSIDKLSRKNNFKTKSDYLKTFYNEGNVKLASLLSSGKDSCYSTYIMMKQNYDIKCLVTIKSKNKDSYMYHTPNVDLVKLQAEAMELPLILVETSGEKEKELSDLEKALVKAKKKYGVEGIVVGAIFSTYQRDRVQKVADKLGLKVFTPLWHKDQESLLKELLENNFEFIIVHIAADGLDKSWLGKKIDLEKVKELVKLSKKYGLNPAGEGGEYESLVLDCPMFKKKLLIKDSEIIIQDKYTGTYFVKKCQLLTK